MTSIYLRPIQAAHELTKTSSRLAIAFAILVLSACSGQDSATSASNTANTSKAAEQQTSKDLAQNPAVLTLTAPAPVTTPSSQFQAQSDIQPQATTANFSPVTRIQNTTLAGSYFFTIYNSERISALVANPRWNEEGTAFWASAVPDAGLSPVHRFRNNFNGSYLYTIYELERADIVARYSATFTYEGPAWYASQTQLAGWLPLYRFRNLTNGTYLFTANEAEKNSIITSYASTFSLEGVAYYVWQSTAAAPVSSNTVCGIPNFNAEILAFTNAYRAAGAVCGGVYYPPVAPLVWNAKLEQAALVHSTDMADNNYFSHTSRTTGSSPWDRFAAAGYTLSSGGENIAAGHRSIRQVMLGWIESPGHCTGVMSASYRDIGVSCKINPASDYKYYWTMDLAAPR
jgi:uncharacterized protein YkwD